MHLVGMDLCPQRATGINGCLPRHVHSLRRQLGRNVRQYDFPLDIHAVAILQAHDLSFRAIDFVDPDHWDRLSSGIRQGSPRTLYAVPIPVKPYYSNTCLVSETRHTDDEDALCTPYIRDDISEISTEKVEFPSQGYLVPTFSAAFGSNNEGAPPEKSQFPNPQMGPRFFNGSSVPFDQQTVSQPPPVYTRQQLPASIPHLYQYDRSVSDHSRTNSDATSDDSHVSRNPSGRKRWVIE